MPKTYPNYPRPSWHQSRNPAPWWHPTKWTVVTESTPDAGIGFMRVDTEAQAETYADNVYRQNPHAGIAIIPPKGAQA